MEGVGAPMIVLLLAALVGGLVSFALLLPYGALTALLGAQLGASLLGFLVCPALAFQRPKGSRSRAPRSGSSREPDPESIIRGRYRPLATLPANH